jgi:EmrB/QacA subfamily drug resistance transporter
VSEREVNPALVLLLASAATFVAFLDVTIVNIALPDLRADFPDASLALVSWVVSGYAVVFAAALTPAGRLADTLGRKAVFLVGFAVFTVASAACALAPSVGALIAVRAVQGLGAALMIPAALGLVLATAPPEKRAAAVGLWGAATSFAAVAGPALGGLLVDGFGWRSVFVVNVPLGIAVLAVGLRELPDRLTATRQAPDLIGTVLLALGFGGIAGGVTEAGPRGWDDPLVLGLIAAGLLLLVPALARARKHPAPALEIALWRDRAFAAANAGTGLFGFALYAWLLGGVLFITGVWGWSILEAGFAVTPGALASAVAAVLAGRIADRRGAAPLIVIGAVFMAASAGWVVAGLDTEPDFLGFWLWTGLLSGVGFGSMSVGLTAAAAKALPPQSFAAGVGLNTTARQLGGALGVALLAAILESDPGVSGYQSAFALCGLATVLVGVGALAAASRPVSLQVLRGPETTSASRPSRNV